MKKMKAILFDVDDTIYSHKLKRIPELTKYTIKKLKENGYILGLCTSRFPREFQSLPNDIFDDFDLVIADTGGIILKDNKIIHIESMNKEDIDQCIQYLDKQKNMFYLWVPVDGQPHFSSEPSEHLRQHNISWSGYCPTVQKYHNEPLTNILFFDADENQMNEIIEMVGRESVENWGTSGHINPKGINKAYGLQYFCNYFHLSLDEVVCFGDGRNDITMIENAGIGIAVGNAHQKLKKHADYVCDTIENGGIYDICVKLGFIEPIDTKIFFFDIDSTTYIHRIHDNPESTKLAFKKLRENGYKLYICTSRSYEEMKELPKHFLDAMDGIACLGGAHLILDGKHEMTTMDHEEAKNVLNYLDEKGVVYRYCTNDAHGYLNQFDQDKCDLFYRLYQMVPPIKKYENEEVTHILYYVNSEEDKKNTNEMLKNSSVVRLNVASEATAKGISKASAIEHIAKHYGYTLRNCVAFGDGRNDISMLEAAGIGIAMGNAHDDVKVIADYVTDHIEEDGLYNACVHFGWIQ